MHKTPVAYQPCGNTRDKAIVWAQLFYWDFFYHSFSCGESFCPFCRLQVTHRNELGGLCVGRSVLNLLVSGLNCWAELGVAHLFKLYSTDNKYLEVRGIKVSSFPQTTPYIFLQKKKKLVSFGSEGSDA